VAGTASAVTLGTRGGAERDRSAAAVAPGKCAPARELAAPGFSAVYVMGADPTGRYVIGTGVSDKDKKGWMLLWRDGAATAVEIPYPSRPISVNSAGVVVGGTLTYPPEMSVGWVYQDGELRAVAPPDGYQYASVAAINERGDMAGTAVREPDSWTAVLWPAAAPDKPVTLDAPSNAVVEDIADDGTVVGGLYEDTSVYMGVNAGKPYAWSPDGRGRDLDTPAGWAGAKALRVRDGWIHGYAHEGARAEWMTEPWAGHGLKLAPVRWRIDGTAAELPAPTGGTVAGTTDAGWWLVNASGPRMVTVDGRAIEVDLAEPTTERASFFGDAFWVGDATGSEVVVYGNAPLAAAPERTRALRWVCQLPPR
jgi:hypothetical protein